MSLITCSLSKSPIIVGNSGIGPAKGALSIQWVVAALCPVRKLILEATQTGVEAHALVKRMPEAAIESIASVFNKEFPAQLMASARC